MVVDNGHNKHSIRTIYASQHLGFFTKITMTCCVTEFVSVQLELSLVHFQHCGVGVSLVCVSYLHAMNGQVDSDEVAEAS